MLLIRLVLMLVFCSGLMVLGQKPSPPLTTCEEVLRLRPEEADQNRPVRLVGTVTCFAPDGFLFFLQDATAGLYVFPTPWPKDLEFGDVVEITGVSGAGLYSRIVDEGKVRRTGKKATLTPRRITIADLNTGAFDCQYVEVEGVVQKVNFVNEVLHLQLTKGGASLLALMYGTPTNVNSWVDAGIRIRGVAGTFYLHEKLDGFGIFTQEPSMAEVIRNAPEPFAVPARTTRKVSWDAPGETLDHRRRFAGIVTLSWPGEAFFVKDEHGVLRVANPSGAAPEPGDNVEVSGFLRNSLEPLEMTEAVWRKMGSGLISEAKFEPLSTILHTTASGRRYLVEGTVVAIEENSTHQVLTLEQEGQTLPVFTRSALPPNLSGATVRASGNFSSPPNSITNNSKAGLWLQTNGLTVLSIAPPPGVTKRRSEFWLVTAIGGLIATGAFAWKARAAKVEADGNRERMKNAERGLDELKAAKERLGRDLHDHIIQSIYAIGLNLEDCRLSLSDPRKTDARLTTTLTEINEVIRELRNVILGLESNTIQPKEFRTALKSLALTLGHEGSNRISLQVENAAMDLLTPVQATELMHIAREAMSNSVRHGQSRTTNVRLHTVEDEIRFVVEDDGCGFATSAAESKGYGLRNMAKRADSIGAKFTVSSEAGHGTRIVLDIPK